MNVTYFVNGLFEGVQSNIDVVERGGRVCGSKISVTHIAVNHQSYLITHVAIAWLNTARVTPRYTGIAEKTILFWFKCVKCSSP